MNAYELLKEYLSGSGRGKSAQNLAPVSRSGENTVSRAELLSAFSSRSGNAGLDLPAPFVPRDQLSLINPDSLLSLLGDQSGNVLLEDPIGLLPGHGDWLGPIMDAGLVVDPGDAGPPSGPDTVIFDTWYDLIAGQRNAMAELDSQLFYGAGNRLEVSLAPSAGPEGDR